MADVPNCLGDSRGLEVPRLASAETPSPGQHCGPWSRSPFLGPSPCTAIVWLSMLLSSKSQLSFVGLKPSLENRTRKGLDVVFGPALFTAGCSMFFPFHLIEEWFLSSPLGLSC